MTRVIMCAVSLTVCKNKHMHKQKCRTISLKSCFPPLVPASYVIDSFLVFDWQFISDWHVEIVRLCYWKQHLTAFSPKLHQSVVEWKWENLTYKKKSCGCGISCISSFLKDQPLRDDWSVPKIKHKHKHNTAERHNMATNPQYPFPNSHACLLLLFWV